MRRAVASSLLALALVAGPAQARTIRPLPPSWQKGANVAAFRWNDLDGAVFRTWMRRLRHGAHADYVAFATRWFQYWRDPLRSDDLTATDIRPAYGSAATCRRARPGDQTRCQTPSLASERRAIRHAQGLGLRIVIKPMVDVGRDAGLGYGRDSVALSGAAREAWFASYAAMLAQYARLARDVEADMLVVGTGLAGMTDDADDVAHWRALIADLRSGRLMGDGRGGYDGALTFAARWDAIYADAADPAQHLFFWDDLDFIGVEGFWPLIGGRDPDHDDPSVARLRQGWTLNFLRGGMPPGAAVRALRLEYGKPVLLTGLGYLSRGGTAADPSKGDGAQRQAGGRYNARAQARAYRAAFDFWAGVASRGSWFRGIYWWNWSPSVRHLRNGDYSPQGKPAEVELCLRHLGRASRSCRRSRAP